MYIHNIFKSALALLVSAFAFASCMQVEEGADGAVGYLSAPTLDVDVTVEDLIDTKATVDFFAEAPDLADVHFQVKDKDGVVKHDAKGLWETMRMPVGKYSIKATHGSNGFGAAYFTAETADDAYIDAYEDEKPVLNLQLANALLKVSVPDTFAEHFTLEKVTLAAVGFNTVEASAAEISTWYYVPADVEIVVTIIGKNSVGNDKSFEKKVTLAAKSARTIMCGDKADSMPSIELDDQSAGAWAGRLYVTPATFTNISAENQAKVVYEVSASGNWDDVKTSEVIMDADGVATAYHVVKGLENGKTYSVRARIGNLLSDNIITDVTVQEQIPVTVDLEHDYSETILTGSHASLTVDLGAGILKTLHDEGIMDVNSTLRKNGTIVRTSSELSGNMVDNTSNWPYLPKGTDYELTVGLRTSVDAEDVKAFALSGIVSDAPSVSISLTSYCSYDKYLEYKAGNSNALATANDTDAYTVKDMGVVWNISETIMNKEHYSRSLTFQGINVSNTELKGISYDTEDITDRVVGENYEVSAKFVFDGIEAADSKTHHITGLPYYSSPPKEADWISHTPTGNAKISWSNSDYVQLTGKKGEAKISYEDFDIPTGKEIDINIYEKYRPNGISGFSYKLILGTTDVFEEKRSRLESEQQERTDPCIMSSSNSSITLRVYYEYNLSGYYYEIYTFNVLYR